MNEWELRRVQDGAVVYKALVQEGSTFQWTPYYPLIGRFQWYTRRMGMKRWFKRGPVRDGY